MSTTSITGTVTDSDGTVWTNAVWKLAFQPNPSHPNVADYTINGVPLDPNIMNQSGVTDGSGAFAFTCYDNMTVTPLGSSFQLTIAPMASSGAGVYGWVATGASMDLSSALTAAFTAPRFIAVAGSYGYADIEALHQYAVGATYFNTTTKTQRIFDGSSWDASASSDSQNRAIVCWGDSLTQGYQGSSVKRDAYPNLLRNSLGISTVNKGIGGNTSSQIGVRQGSVATTCTVTGGVIPACTALPNTNGVVITPLVGFEPVTSTGPRGGVIAIIAGVTGVITLSGSTYTFTPTALGPQVSAAGTQSVTIVNNYTNSFSVFWAGRNNYPSPTQVMSDLTAMVNSVTGGQSYLALSIVNSCTASEQSGSANYNSIIALNSQIAALAGTNYLDIRAAIIAAYNPSNIVDASCHANDVPPPSLMAILAQRTLTQDIGTSDTSFTVSASLTVGENIVIDNELMFITGYNSGTLTVTVTRGVFGTLAAHTNGTPFIERDHLHYSSDGYAVIANAIAGRIKASGWYASASTYNALAGALTPQMVQYKNNNLTIVPDGVQVDTSMGSPNISIGKTALQALTTGSNNIGIGYQALQAATTGSFNVGVGVGAIALNTTGTSNVAVGLNALFNSLTGSNCTAIGNQALLNATSSFNTAVGAFALQALTSGGNLTAVGYFAGNSVTVNNGSTYIGASAGSAATGNSQVAVGINAAQNSTADGITAIGASALTTNTSGSSNTAIGFFALNLNNTTNDNTAVGYTALQNNVAAQNTAIGSKSLVANTSGGLNVAIGYNTLAAVTTNGNNTAVGAQALAAATGGQHTAVGYAACLNITSGVNNVAVGYNAGRFIADGSTSNVTGTQSVYIGSGAYPNANGEANEIVIGFNAIGAGSNKAVLGNGSITDVYFGSSAGSAILHAKNLPLTGTTAAIGGSALAVGAIASGTVTVTGAAVAMCAVAQPTDGTNMAASGFIVSACVTATNTVTVSVMAVLAGTPASKTYAVRVLQ